MKWTEILILNVLCPLEFRQPIIISVVTLGKNKHLRPVCILKPQAVPSSFRRFAAAENEQQSLISWQNATEFQTVYFGAVSSTVGPDSWNPPKISLFVLISWIIPSKFQQIHMTSVSGHCTQFIFKICQTVAGIRITSQFLDF